MESSTLGFVDILYNRRNIGTISMIIRETEYYYRAVSKFDMT